MGILSRDGKGGLARVPAYAALTGSCIRAEDPHDLRRPARRRGRLAEARGRGLLLTLALLVTCLAALAGGAGCGSPSAARPQEELVAEKALWAALEGERSEFVAVVAPSFVEEARSQMPDADDETLGGVLIAGFMQGIPFAGIKEAAYSVEGSGDRAAVYVWGSFVSPDGSVMELAEGDALRVPLRCEGGRWYLDLLDL